MKKRIIASILILAMIHVPGPNIYAAESTEINEAVATDSDAETYGRMQNGNSLANVYTAKASEGEEIKGGINCT